MILKIDTTSANKVLVSLEDKERKIQDEIVEEQKLGSQVLLPTIVKILKKHGLSFKDLKEVEVNTGPGSFTGTRVGVAAANAIGFALNIPVNGKKGKIALPKYKKSKFD